MLHCMYLAAIRQDLASLSPSLSISLSLSRITLRVWLFVRLDLLNLARNGRSGETLRASIPPKEGGKKKEQPTCQGCDSPL